MGTGAIGKKPKAHGHSSATAVSSTSFRLEHLEKALGYLLDARGAFSSLSKPLPPPSSTQLLERVPKQRQRINSVLLRLIQTASTQQQQQQLLQQQQQQSKPSKLAHNQARSAAAVAAISKRIAAYKRMYRTALSYGAQAQADSATEQGGGSAISISGQGKNIAELLIELEQLRPSSSSSSSSSSS